jgi:putative ABC transport system substrate-binding protein
VVAGGAISYGGSIRDSCVWSASTPAGFSRVRNLPVQQSTKVELIINLKTAKALGLTVPLALVASADELIE